MNVIYDVCNKTYYDAFLQPRTRADERDALINMIKRNIFIGKNLIITDRGYESYNLFTHFINTENLDFLCRIRNGTGGIPEVANLELRELDIDLSIEITTTQTKEDKTCGRHFIKTGIKKSKRTKSSTHFRRWDFSSPYTLKMRIVRFMLDTGEYETIATSLDRNKFGIEDIKKLYHMRWGVETSFRELKYVIGAVNLHAKKEELVYQEIYAALIMYNYCSRMAHCNAVKKNQKKKYSYKVNFTMAAHICRTFFKTYSTDFPNLIFDICKYTEPIREGRQDQRTVRPKRFAGFTYRVAA